MLLLWGCGQLEPVSTPSESGEKPPVAVAPGEEKPAPENPAGGEETPEGKPRYVWIDASANFPWFASDKEEIAREVASIAGCGFTDIVVDVRPTEGTVLWASSIAPEARRLAAWVEGKYRFVEREATFDYLQAFLDEGHANGLRVHAALNTFVGGYGGLYGLEDEGPIFTGDIPADWAAVDNTAEGLRSSFYEGVQGTVFLNPAHDGVQAYLLSLLREVAAYHPDGIILDRCRYGDSGLQSDFSEQSHARFVEYLGGDPVKWPIFPAGTTSLPATLIPHQKAWLSLRAKVIHDFVQEAADTVHGVDPDIAFGVYVGAWYSSYYVSGVNWASPDYPTHTHYSSWADSDYHNYGFADHCDQMLLGCYTSASQIYGSGEWTMEGFCRQGADLLMGDTRFAGGPDIGNPPGWSAGEQGSKIAKTVDVCINNSDGYFVFDLCHIREFDYWGAFRSAFGNYLNSLTQ